MTTVNLALVPHGQDLRPGWLARARTTVHGVRVLVGARLRAARPEAWLALVLGLLLLLFLVALFLQPTVGRGGR